MVYPKRDHPIGFVLSTPCTEQPGLGISARRVQGLGSTAGRSCRRRCGVASHAVLPLDTEFYHNATAYFNDLAVLHRYIGVTPGLARYGHPLLMTLSVLTLGAFSVQTAFRARVNGPNSPLRSVHASLMATLLLIFVAGFGGGSLSNVMLNHDLWSSVHTYSAALLILLLTLNAALGFIKAKGLHTMVGMSTIGSFVVHVLTGLQLLFRE